MAEKKKLTRKKKPKVSQKEVLETVKEKLDSKTTPKVKKKPLTNWEKQLPTNDNGQFICGAKTRRGTLCQQVAGFGTHHVGTGRCKYHGGSSNGAPIGNQNARKTSEHDSIYADLLDADEKIMFDEMTSDVIHHLDEEIKLTTIRERRMLERIGLLVLGDTLVVVERTDDTSKGTNIVHQNKLQLIQEIEESLTRVQDKKAKLLDLKQRIVDLSGGEGDEDNFISLAETLKRSISRISRPVIKEEDIEEEGEVDGKEQ